jgi:hypothetical protein
MVMTEDEEVRFLLISGRPIGEPIAWYGSIVMNTREELRATIPTDGMVPPGESGGCQILDNKREARLMQKVLYV